MSDKLRAKVEAGQTVVVHLRRDQEMVDWARERGLYVRIDRQTRWGNPYQIGRHGDRDAVCELFEEKRLPYLLSDIEELRGKVLGCWCAPSRCHGDALARAANAYTEKADS